MKRENGIINLGAISILLVSTIMMSVGVFVYNSKTSVLDKANSLKNSYNETYYNENSTNHTFDNYTFDNDDDLDYDLNNYSNYTNYSFGNFTEE